MFLKMFKAVSTMVLLFFAISASAAGDKIVQATESFHHSEFPCLLTRTCDLNEMEGKLQDQCINGGYSSYVTLQAESVNVRYKRYGVCGATATGNCLVRVRCIK